MFFKKKYIFIHKIIFIFLINNLDTSICNSIKPELHVIGSYQAGFFSIFLGVLNHLKWCDKNNKNPIVYWDQESLYFQPEGYNGKLNAWEYYFEPVSQYSYDKNSNIIRSFVAPDGSAVPLITFDISLFQKWIESFTVYNQIINKYIKINKPVKSKLQSFFVKNMQGKKTIGIHFRGTDKFLEAKPISPLKLLGEANKYIGYQYFIATDELKFLELAKKVLKGKVIYYDSYRSTNGNPIHHQNPNRAQRGEEVLIESLLLSKCDTIIHTLSNVSLICYYFNPLLKGILFTPQERILIK